MTSELTVAILQPTVNRVMFNSQLMALEAFLPNTKNTDQLKDLIKELRDEELEHLEMAVEEHSQRAPAHALLSAIIEMGCNVAIQLCRRI